MDILILIGSKNDLSELDGALQTLKKFGVSYELHISSAHRSLKRTVELVESAEKNGVKVIIAAAGMSAHLPGVVSALTVLPVIGVPLNASALNGLDSLLSIVQMPAGIPVATTAIGKSGATNAALLAVSILATSNASLTEKLKKHRKEMEKSVIDADNELNSKVI
ncbi:MAG: 5-(carboxyamino)imidazole ribonucleotide mutase [bacterium]